MSLAGQMTPLDFTHTWKRSQLSERSGAWPESSLGHGSKGLARLLGRRDLRASAVT